MVSDPAVGIYGLRGSGRHYATVLDDGGLPVIGADPDEDIRRSFEEEFDGVVTDSLESLLEMPLDGLIVATPNRYRLEPIQTATSAGLPVLAHKPLAHDFDAAREIQERLDGTSGTCYVGFRHRCGSVVQTLRQAIDEGAYGEIYHIETTYGRPFGLPAVGSWKTSRDLSGGGALLDLGSLMIDTGQYLLGTPRIGRVAGVVRQNYDPHQQPSLYQMGKPSSRKRSDVEDSGTALVAFEGGVSLSVDAHYTWHHPRREEIRVFGDEGAAVVGFETETYVEYEQDIAAEETIDTTEESWWRDTYQRSERDVEVEDWVGDTQTGRVDAFLDAIDGRETTLATVAEGVLVQDIIERVYDESRDSI
jgi:predicted dehydrogenase